MKTCILLLAACALSAQEPPPTDPATVVATFPDGANLTLGDLRSTMQQDPRFMQAFRQDPVRAIKELYITRYAAQQGEKLKLDEDPLWKEQFEIARRQVMVQAMFTYERNHFVVSEQDTEEYYKRNQSRYEQVEVKIIQVAFKPSPPASKSAEDMARYSVEVEHSLNSRSEADARKLSADLVKQLGAGADFANLAEQYSDDAESKKDGGNFGVVKPSGPYPENFKKAVLALKPGEVGEPFQVGNSFYVARVEKKSAQPLDAVRVQIIDELKDAHLRDYLASLEKRFQPAIQHPEVLAQLNANAPKSK
jgi:parvulin-like peptidyl-prolyl isomerase